MAISRSLSIFSKEVRARYTKKQGFLKQLRNPEKNNKLIFAQMKAGSQQLEPIDVGSIHANNT